MFAVEIQFEMNSCDSFFKYSTLETHKLRGQLVHKPVRLE